MSTKERNLSFDVFRILLAFMVFTLHVNGATTGGVFLAVNYAPVKVLVIAFEALCFPAVNCYILLSAYFSFKNKKTIKQQTYSLVKLFICVLTYSVVWFLVVTLAFNKTFNAKDLLIRFFPLTSGAWWYMTNYFALMLISPFLNKIVENTDKKHVLVLIGAMLVVTSIMPFLVKGNDFFGVKMGYSLVWFIVLYLTGAFISKYHFDSSDRKLIYLIGYGVCSLLLPITSIIIGKVGFLNGFTFETYNSVIVFAQAIFLFLFFKNLNIKSQSTFIKKSISFLSREYPSRFLRIISYILIALPLILNFRRKIRWEEVRIRLTQ